MFLWLCFCRQKLPCRSQGQCGGTCGFGPWGEGGGASKPSIFDQSGPKRPPKTHSAGPASLRTKARTYRKLTAAVHMQGFIFWGRVPLDLRFRGPLEAKFFVRSLKPTLLGPREGSSILDVDLAVMAAAVMPRGGGPGGGSGRPFSLGARGFWVGSGPDPGCFFP